MVPIFSTREALRFSWQRVRTESGLVFRVVLTFAVIEFIQLALHSGGGGALSGLASFIVSIVEIVLGAGATVIMLKLAREVPAEFRELLPPARTAFQYVLASLLSGLIVFAALVLPMALGFLALLAPVPPVLQWVAAGAGALVGITLGAYAMLRYSMVKFIAVEGERRVPDILRHSAALTLGVKWRLLRFFIALVLLNLLGFLLLIVGLLVTVPVTMIAAARVYTLLSSAKPVN